MEEEERERERKIPPKSKAGTCNGIQALIGSNTSGFNCIANS
jgi:hypothetical protein